MTDSLLPLWGPYSKYLAGAGFLSDPERGIRDDFCFYPALYRRRQNPPFLSWDSGFHPWDAAPDLRYWSFRFPLTDKREFYADIRYERTAEGLDITVCFVNGTDLPQAAALQGLITRRLPERGPYRQPPLHAAGMTLPEGAVWRCASDFQFLHFQEDSPHRHLPADACPTGVVRRDGMVDGRGLGDGFGSTAGDAVRFDALPAAARLLFRYRCEANAQFTLEGLARGPLTLPASADWTTCSLPVSEPDAGFLLLSSGGRAAIELDGIALLPPDAPDPVVSLPENLDLPELTKSAHTLSLHYPGDAGGYTLNWPADISRQIREIYSDRLEYDMPLATHNHVPDVIGTPGEKHYTNLYLRPIRIAPGETREFHLSVGSTHAKPPGFQGAEAPGLPPAPFGVERLRATLLTNVVFPVHYKRGYIAHHCPGKFWDSLYTWDSGFVGLGMCEVNPDLAEEILCRYLALPGDDFAYVHHGSTVPVQIHLLQVLFNRRGGDKTLLRRAFDGARRMHRFLAGRAEGSITAELRSGLLCPFPYFYNSGGWDDYPPQWKLWKEQRTRGVTPVITSAQLIRTAKLLRRTALILGEAADEFDQDIQDLSQALFDHAWNPDTGWFSYVLHDDEGRPLEKMLHPGGEDFNAGLDGLYPLLAGICPPEMEADFIARLKDPSRFWSPVGLSTVDMSAAVYKTDGYWNGSVWMPHQWFVWRYLLDIGEADFALAIARRALELWEREVRESWCCFEHFPVATERGAGWHHFGGLSAPVLNWHAALHTSGRLSGGYNTWVLSHRRDETGFTAELLLDGRPEDRPVLFYVQPGTPLPELTWTGAGRVEVSRNRDLLIFSFDRGQDRGVLTCFIS